MFISILTPHLSPDHDERFKSLQGIFKKRFFPVDLPVC